MDGLKKLIARQEKKEQIESFVRRSIGTMEPARRPDKNIAAHKFFLALVLFSAVTLLLVAPVLHIDLSLPILLIMSVSCLFMLLRTVNILRLARRLVASIKRYIHGTAVAPSLKWNHLIVVPIYKESIETIANTIGALSRHRDAASHYVVLCAHETADKDHEKKFRRIHEMFAHRFSDLVKSVHVLDPMECPGKAANVNHAVRFHSASQPFEVYSRTMVTVIDCDTLVEERYFWELERMASAADDPHSVIFAAPTFFENNRNAVPCLVRAMDDLWSMAAAANIFSNSKLGFPISNYSLSIQMLEAMDYWDVDYDSVGEDFHTFIKASIKLKKNIRLVPVAVPMNNENVIGHAYFSSVLARYSQALRHALGISSTAYLFKHVLTSSFSVRKWLLFLLCLESHSFPLLYFATGIYVFECVYMGNFFTYFRDEKLLLFGGLTAATVALLNVCFGIYKAIQFFIRHRWFRKPFNFVEEVRSDISDVIVQPLCFIGYFFVPFGFRAYQHLFFWTNKGFYNRIEESARKY